MSSVHKNNIKINFDKNIYLESNAKNFNLIVDIVQNTHLTAISRKIQKNQELFDWINASLPKLQDNFYNLRTKIYWILTGLTDFPLCDNCKNKLIRKNVRIHTGYNARSSKISF